MKSVASWAIISNYRSVWTCVTMYPEPLFHDIAIDTSASDVYLTIIMKIVVTSE